VLLFVKHQMVGQRKPLANQSQLQLIKRRNLTVNDG
jgi:hypothetical protein